MTLTQTRKTLWRAAAVGALSTIFAISYAQAARNKTYKIRKGDNLWVVAKRFKLQVKDIARLNRLNENKLLRPGKVIQLPIAETPRHEKSRKPQVAVHQRAPKSGKVASFAFVTSKRAPIYAHTTGSKRVRTVQRHKRLALVGKKGEWLKILLADKSIGWLHRKYASVPAERKVASATQSLGKLQAVASRAMVASSREVIAFLKNEAPALSSIYPPAEVAQQLNKEIESDTQASEQVAQTALLLARLNRDKEQPTLDELTKSFGNERYAQQALRYLKTRYRFGGLSSRGLDCSGLIVRVFKDLGMHAPRTAAEQFKLGMPVLREQLQPGDLIFFKNTYRRGISHVGIYLGNEKFVHASSGGRSVRISNLNEKYYRNHWAGAKRIAV